MASRGWTACVAAGCVLGASFARPLAAQDEKVPPPKKAPAAAAKKPAADKPAPTPPPPPSAIGWNAAMLAKAATNAPPVPVLGHNVDEKTLRDAYAKLWKRYAIRTVSHELVKLREADAFVVQGYALRIEAGKRLLIAESEGEDAAPTSCVITRFPYGGPLGKRVSFVAIKPCGDQYFLPHDWPDYQGLPIYYDGTMTYDDFISYLRAGAHFPEAPELDTQPNRHGLSLVGRVETNYVNLLRKQFHLDDPPSTNKTEKAEKPAK